MKHQLVKNPTAGTDATGKKEKNKARTEVKAEIKPAEEKSMETNTREKPAK